ncbi:hypothetical protein L7F22_022891 [Adiantum nelumboides]|nr:hypothetical protein [Adiantum nelumboides]
MTRGEVGSDKEGAQLCLLSPKLFITSFCFLLRKWQTEEDGVMGGHTTRTKQSVKASPTVICDLAATAEDWKQQIKVKDSIPVNQQRLTFTSQRATKQTFALAKLIPSRQWQIVVDASLEDICNDLRHWRATLRAENISAELFQPLVLKESEALASLHSRTADELREIGVPCRVFFLSFEEWITPLQTKELSPSNREPRGLDLKVDEEFRENIFLIDLYGDLNGVPIPVPLRYEMNGSQLATKLFMVEQTARYREDQKQRYQHCLVPALKDSNAEKGEGSKEVNSQTSCNNDYILEIEQSCELTAFISRDHHRLRCIVLPVITIPLVETKGSEQRPYICLQNEDLNKVPRESATDVLALPSALEVGEASISAARSDVDEQHSSAIPVISMQKNTKKKRKKKGKKTAKEDVKNCTCLRHDVTVEAELPCQGPLMKHSQEEGAVDGANCLNAGNAADTKMDDGDELQLSPGNNFKPDSTLPIQDLPLAEVEKMADSLKQRTSLVHVDQQQTCDSTLGASKCHLSNRQNQINEKGPDHATPAMNIKKEPGFSVDIGTSDETGKVGNTFVHKETSPPCNPNTLMHDHFDLHGSLSLKAVAPVQHTSASGCNSGSYSIPKLAGSMKQSKESVHSKLQAEIPNTIRKETSGDYPRISGFQNESWDQSGSLTRLQQQSLWIHRAGEGQYYVPHRSRSNQNYYTSVTPDESRSSAPFWRHQKDGRPVSSHSWSKPRPLRVDDGGRFPTWSTLRELRNMSAWEQPPSIGSTIPLHWENPPSLDRSWSKGQNYNSFNMQQRKLGKRNKISPKFFNRWQCEEMPNDRVPLKSNLSDAVCSTSTNYSNTKAEHTETFLEKDATTCHSVRGPLLGMDLERRVEMCVSSATDALEPCIKGAQTTATTEDSLQDVQLITELDKSSLWSFGTQMAAYVHEVLDAVSASHKSWGIYEQVSSQNGKSLCEFERVAKAVSPTISAAMTKQSWEPMGCLCETLLSRIKILRQIPDVRLSAFWQWYEEPSSYGLKVKLSEPSKRTGRNLQAFFVPYLSAIQLFGWSRKTAQNKDAALAHGGSQFDTGFLNQPILSILLPRPESSDDSNSSEGLLKKTKTSQQEAVNAEQIDIKTLSSSGRQCHCDVELLYEFFELEKPQHRKPLTDRIKELGLQSKLCRDGDGHVLTNAKIEDLHPSSWFAVAWYPIYKIPDESFRSAFLTYHSLSCLQSMCSRSANTDHCLDSCLHTITAPVVGLMSYNAQVNEWFSSSPSCVGRPDDNLQHYLANLESAATSMARGSFENPSRFKHADFTFFQSRGR